jgi:STE24 endopeptidase
VLESTLLALVVAETGRRLLAPREPPIEPVAVEVEAYFSLEEITRGARFARPQRTLALAQGALELGALALLARRPPRWLRRSWKRPIPGGVVTGAALALGLSVLPLPLSAMSRRRAMAAGLDTQSWAAWGGDLVKATAIQAGFAAGASGVALAATRRYPAGWWAPTALGSVAVGAVLAALAPVVLDPLFNDFTPLPDGPTRSDVFELSRAAGVRVKEVYSVDASRRTTAANAYVTGLGPTKRVVLFDTLLDRYGRDEVRLVVAHELAHVRHRDVPRGVVYAAIVAPATMLAVQRLSWELSPERGSPATLPVLALSAAAVSAPIGVIGRRLSRAIERRADAYALELAGVPEAFVSFERAIALQNLADLEPPRWVTTLLSTHPPTLERIGAAIAWSRRRSAGGRPSGNGSGSSPSGA